MIAVKQETPNYCFVACVASMLLDQGTARDAERLQQEIVAQFPTELRKHHPEKSGSPPEDDFDSVNRVVTGLGLASRASWDMLAFDHATSFLKENRDWAHRIFIIIRYPGFHCVRLSRVTNESIEVMDPHQGQFDNWTWDSLRDKYYSLVCLHN